MFDIYHVSTHDGRSSILFGGLPGKELVGPTNALGPVGSVYVLAIPGTGYIKLTDEGNKVPGPGDYSVKFSGSPTNWFYSGANGKATIDISAAGEYKVTGGNNSISGKVTAF